jgi:3-oxoacyl-[acyl-carrier protein] reductase
MNKEFQGKNVLITGGSRGIGRAAALLFAERGANVAIVFEKNVEAAASLVEEVEAFGVTCKSFRMSITDEAAWQMMIAEIAGAWKSLDVVVANAGIWAQARIDEMTLEAFRRTMETNMTGTFLTAKHAAIQMKKQRSGAIVIISSTAGQRGESEHSHYAASKGAQISFTKSLAVELAPFGIRVNCVAPGWVGTEMTAKEMLDPKMAEWITAQIPLGRVAAPSEIAEAICFLASPRSSFVLGEILNVNGGAVLCG